MDSELLSGRVIHSSKDCKLIMDILEESDIRSRMDEVMEVVSLLRDGMAANQYILKPSEGIQRCQICQMTYMRSVRGTLLTTLIKAIRRIEKAMLKILGQCAVQNEPRVAKWRPVYRVQAALE